MTGNFDRGTLGLSTRGDGKGERKVDRKIHMGKLDRR